MVLPALEKVSTFNFIKQTKQCLNDLLVPNITVSVKGMASLEEIEPTKRLIKFFLM